MGTNSINNYTNGNNNSNSNSSNNSASGNSSNSTTTSEIKTPADRLSESSMVIMHLKDNGHNCSPMKLSDFEPYINAPLGDRTKKWQEK